MNDKEAKLLALAKKFSDRPDTSLVELHVRSATGLEFSYSQSPSKTQHLITSTTKPMVASLALKMQQMGRLSLDGSIAKYLTETEVSGLNIWRGQDLSKKITVRDLITQRSGIPNYFKLKTLKRGKDMAARLENDPGWVFQEAIALAKTMRGSFEPGGNSAEYSFSNFQIVSEILERIEGKSLGLLLEEQIFEPLGMKESYLLSFQNLDRFNELSPILVGKETYLGARRIASLRGEGAVVSSSEDVLKFSRALFEGTLESEINLYSQSDSWLPVFPGISYGLGLMRLSFPAVLTGMKKLPVMFGHSGASGHFMFFEPNSQTHLVGTVNQIGDKSLGMRLALSTAKVVFSSPGC